MQYQSALLYMLAALPSALCITTIQAYLAPTNAGASVITAAPEATTYTILCTSLCAAVGDNNQATLVNGPSTAGLTNVQEGGQKTLIWDCKLDGKSDKAECVKKAISTGQTVATTQTLMLAKADVVITAGVEKLGKIAIVTTTAEVNVTQVVATITSGTETVTSGVPKITKPATLTSNSTDHATSAVLATAGGAITSTARGMSEPVQTMSSKGAAPTLSPQRLAATLAGLAWLMFVAL